MKQDDYLYIFLHLHKTGGMTVYNNVRLNLNEDEYILSYRNRNREVGATQGTFAYIRSMPECDRDKIRFIGGHCVDYGVHTLFPNKVPRYIIFFREPYSKTISEYNYQRTLYEEDPESRKARGVVGFGGKLLPFDEEWFFFNGLNPSASFLYNRLFNKLGLILTEGKINQIKELMNTFYFVGIMEDKRDFEILYDLMGLEDKVDITNISKKFVTDEEISKNEKYIYYRNKYDIALYQHALRLNEQFKKERGIPHRIIHSPSYTPHTIGPKKVPFILFDMLVKYAYKDACKDKGALIKISGAVRKSIKRLHASNREQQGQARQDAGNNQSGINRTRLD